MNTATEVTAPAVPRAPAADAPPFVYVYSAVCVTLMDDGWGVPFHLGRLYGTVDEARAAALAAVLKWAVRASIYSQAEVRESFVWVDGARRFAPGENGKFMEDDRKVVVGYWSDSCSYCNEDTQVAVTRVRLPLAVAAAAAAMSNEAAAAEVAVADAALAAYETKVKEAAAKAKAARQAKAAKRARSIMEAGATAVAGAAPAQCT